MTDKPIRRTEQVVGKPTFTTPTETQVDEFKLRVLNEVHAGIMTVTFLVSAFTVFNYFNITVITVMEATRWLALLGGCGFMALFLVRIKLRLTLMDGLFYNVFGIAPALFALMLFVNAQCGSEYQETYKVTGRQREGSGYTLQLSDDAYGNYWHIRNLSADEANKRSGKLRFTFCNGVFGYKVMKGREMVR